jgi:hypothetical protein
LYLYISVHVMSHCHALVLHLQGTKLQTLHRRPLHPGSHQQVGDW